MQNQSQNHTIRLTQTVQKGGCAAKIAATELRQILNQVQFPPSPLELMVDSGTFDDAAILKVNDELALVQTLDFFTPIVDSPRTFGAIAAANALSDVYAMGGVPKTAMAILAFPLISMESSVIVEVLQGASDKIKESGAAFVGGHSIDDDSLKFGLSVTGYVHPSRVWSNANAKVGDKLILTKALGTGTMTAALKRNEATEDDIREALDSMAKLNNVVTLLSSEQMNQINAATDITGFALSGHGMQMATASGVSLMINAKALPIMKRAKEFLEAGFLTKAHRTNRQYTEAQVNGSELTEIETLLINDPQTSGGLLLSVSSTYADEILRTIQKSFQQAVIIGEVENYHGHRVVFRA